MADLILAWHSTDARDRTVKRLGHKAKQYKDRPIRKSFWTKKRDHPIPGLNHYEIQEPSE